MAVKEIPDADILRQRFNYDPETGVLSHASRPSVATFTSVTDQGYLRGKIFGKGYLAHRVIWKMVYGQDPEFIDHINGNRQDNRLLNLRAATVADNMRNRKKPSTNRTGVCGVYRTSCSARWFAAIVKDGKRFKRSFVTLAEATAWRKSMEVSLGFHSNHGR